MNPTIALCSSMFCFSYLLLSPNPYIGFMMMGLIEGSNLDNVGGYVGIILASFMVGRALSAYPWGKIADIYGRKFVLLSSMFLSGIFSLAFGCSRTFTAAVTTRFLLGLSNGMISTANTCMSELARGDEELEIRTIGLFVKTYGISMVVAPLVSGYLSRPRIQHPEASAILLPGKIGEIISHVPFVLPNLFGTFACFISAVLIYFYVEETLPEKVRRDAKYFFRDCCTWSIQGFSKKRDSAAPKDITTKTEDLDNTNTQAATPLDYDIDDFRVLKENHFEELAMLFSAASSRAVYASQLHHSSVEIPYDDASEESIPLQSARATKRRSIYLSEVPEESILDTTTPSSIPPKRRTGIYLSVLPESLKLKTTTIFALLSQKQLRNHLISFWLSNFIEASGSAIIPLFCMSTGGLNMSEVYIGKVLSFSGMLFNLAQYNIFTAMVKHCALYPSMNISIFLSTVPFIFIPVSIPLNKSAQDGDVTWAAGLYLIIMFAILKIFCGVFHGAITAGINRSVDAKNRAQVNGLAVMGSSVARALGPILAGYSVTFCLTSGTFSSTQLGAAVIFVILTIIGLIAIIFTCFLSDGDKCCMDDL